MSPHLLNILSINIYAVFVLEFQKSLLWYFFLHTVSVEDKVHRRVEKELFHGK